MRRFMNRAIFGEGSKDYSASRSQFRMRHDCEMLKPETANIENLLISAPLFIDLYDSIPSVLGNREGTPLDADDKP
jgi:hypothetical protein